MQTECTRTHACTHARTPTHTRTRNGSGGKELYEVSEGGGRESAIYNHMAVMAARDHGSDGKVVKKVCEDLPDGGVAVLAHALVVEPVHLLRHFSYC